MSFVSFDSENVVKAFDQYNKNVAIAIASANGEQIFIDAFADANEFGAFSSSISIASG